jgi:cyclopropane-fatty-acyl-phospholipid synthase
MNYSSALFDGDLTQPMPQAQHAKVRRALRECGLQPGQRLLEIGCGWGALAEAAAADFGARVTGVTLSTEQLAYRASACATRGLDAAADLRLQDYRDIADEPFDAIADRDVRGRGPRVLGQLLPRCAASSSPAARPASRPSPSATTCSSATCADRLHPAVHLSRRPAAQPAGLPRRGAPAGLEVVNELAFGADYAETLRRWRAHFLARDGQVRKLGFDTRFMRIWEFYLAYCEAAFATGNTNVVQFTLRRPA